MNKITFHCCSSFVVGSIFGWLVYAVVSSLIEDLIWVKVLLLFGFSGSFGGILAALQTTDIANLLYSSEDSHWSRARAQNVGMALIISSIGGMGGASAALLIMALDKRIQMPPTDIDRLAYIGVGVISGFLGYKVLGRIAEQFMETLRVKQVADESAVKERRKSDNLHAAITKGIAAQEKGADQILVDAAITELESALREVPDHRMAAVVLSWLHANRKNDLSKALQILRNALDVMRRTGNETPINKAALLYNCACYHYRLAQASSAADKQMHLEQMYKDLEESIRLCPDNKSMACNDPAGDFKDVLGEERFKELSK